MQTKGKETSYRVSVLFVLALILGSFALSFWLPGILQIIRVVLPPIPSRQWAPLPSRVVIGMATMGGRASVLAENLPALFNQTYPVDLVIVSIARGDPEVVMKGLSSFGPFTPGLPSSFPALSSTPNISSGAGSGKKLFTGMKGKLLLQFFYEDWGPGTKLVGAHLVVGSSDETVIVVLDDDCTYPPNHVETLVRHMPADKGAVSGYCEQPLLILPGAWMRTDKVYSYLYHWFLLDGMFSECKGWSMGFGGVAYWASSFKEDVVTFLSTLPKGCFYHDDVWLAGYLFERGVKRYLLYGMSVPRHGQHSNLSIHSGENTAQVHQRPCVEHFKLFVNR